METDFKIPLMMEKTLKIPKMKEEEKKEKGNEELDFSDFDLRESVEKKKKIEEKE